MKTTTITTTLLLALTSTAAFADTVCRTEGEASISPFAIDAPQKSLGIIFAPPEDEHHGNEKIIRTGNELGTSTGVIEGSDIVFRGRPSVGGLVYGTYPDWDGKETTARAMIEVSINWKPDGREVCTKHKQVFSKGRKCVRREMEYFPTSFVLDLTTEAGTKRHYIHTFQNINQANHWTIVTPTLRCFGPIEKFEARILDLNGGEVAEFRVHKIKYTGTWKY